MKPACEPRRKYWLPLSTGNLTADTDNAFTLDFMALLGREDPLVVSWWRLDDIIAVRSGGTATGILQVNGFKTEGKDLGADVLCGGQPYQIVGLGLLLPRFWKGSLDVNIINRTGATAPFRLAFGIEPVDFEGAVLEGEAADG